MDFINQFASWNDVVNHVYGAWTLVGNFDIEAWFLPIIAILSISLILGIITLRIKSHRYRETLLGAYNPMVTLGSLSMLALTFLFVMKNVGIFEMAPFTYVTMGLGNSTIVGGILFCVALAPLVDEVRHHLLHHR